MRPVPHKKTVSFTITVAITMLFIAVALSPVLLVAALLAIVFGLLWLMVHTVLFERFI